MFIQTIRLLTVIFTVPFLAIHGLKDELSTKAGVLGAIGGHTIWGSLQIGADAVVARPLFIVFIVIGLLAAVWIALKLRFPIPHLLGPILVAGALMVFGFEPPHIPSLFNFMAQWSLGIYLGIGIKLSSLENWRKLLPYSILGSGAVVLFSLAMSYVFNEIHAMSVLTAFLSTSPGGMTEMGITASTVGADVSVVVAYQMFRILFILFIVPYVLRVGIHRFYKPRSDRSG